MATKKDEIKKLEQEGAKINMNMTIGMVILVGLIAFQCVILYTSYMNNKAAKA